MSQGFYKTFFRSSQKLIIDSQRRIVLVQTDQRKLIGYYLLFIPVVFSLVGCIYTVHSFIRGNSAVPLVGVIIHVLIGAYHGCTVIAKLILITDGTELAHWLNRTAFLRNRILKENPIRAKHNMGVFKLTLMRK